MTCELPQRQDEIPSVVESAERLRKEFFCSDHRQPSFLDSASRRKPPLYETHAVAFRCRIAIEFSR
jgi:hypothetical protein